MHHSLFLPTNIPAQHVHSTLRQHMLADGFDMVLDLHGSKGSYMIDAATGERFLDLFTCFASMPIGMNHPKLSDPEFIYYLGMVALNKPSNSDLYTEEMAAFVDTFFKLAVPKHFAYSFYVEGGALANENAMKAAFDWKVQKNFSKGYRYERGHRVMHFRQAFHGRSGYTMSLTNTDEKKVRYFPKFQDWPRIINPAMRFPLTPENLEHTIALEKQALEEMKQAFFEMKDEIAAIIIEPIQGEGGDNHFRPEFLQTLRQLCDENDALLIFDEVQTGVGITGTWWAHEQLGVQPDLMTFGKKMQVCGVLASKRLDEVPDNVFHVPGRINSTWGGNLVDMVRAARYLHIIHEENMLQNARTVGQYLVSQITTLAQEFPSLISNPRGRGLFAAFDLPSPAQRDEFRRLCYDHKVIILACGIQSIRFRPPLNLTTEQVDEGINVMRQALRRMQQHIDC
ncbi:MAG: L-lysine 6-transaminase [Bacteroidota bacterium]|nr:L-lysine 6-transaminase [Candidatus Kapabacteria bacterium]MDW8219105.1 L-lysine 6-transaminase [Bacteroidota bacterium]